MAQDISVMFLGTSSGGGPTKFRNCSSLVMDIVGDGSLWMVDCAEGTTRQFDCQPFYGAQRYKSGRLMNIFITHMHSDHTMGLIGLLKNLLGIPKPDQTPSLKVHLYGPMGLRNFVRSIFTMTDSRTMDKYVVHELLRSGEQPSAPCTPEALHQSEVDGLDIPCGEDGFWRGFAHVKGKRGRRDISVDAGPITHRVPCLGYVMRESISMSSTKRSAGDEDEEQKSLRKVVVLGDTNSPAAIIPLVNSSPGHVSLLVHEATDCCIPHSIDPNGITGKNRTPESVHNVSLERGHSTPSMAGDFAKAINAERLYLNHLGGRFPTPLIPARSNYERFKLGVIKEIEKQATEAWDHPQKAHAVAAQDFTRVVIPALPQQIPPIFPSEVETYAVDGPLPSTSSHGGPHGTATNFRGQTRNLWTAASSRSGGQRSDKERGYNVGGEEDYQEPRRFGKRRR